MKESKVCFSTFPRVQHEYQCQLSLDTDQFDESLDRRVWSLSDQRLKWDLEIAKKRRGIPHEVENLMGDLLEKQKEHNLSRDTEGPQPMDEDDPLQGTCPPILGSRPHL